QFDWVQIPAGKFVMGEGKEQHSVDLSAYLIARTPITNAQYKRFVDETGYDPPRHWDSGEIPKDKDAHPVVYVSWDDVMAFCKWAGVRLPTEAEWEKAARGAEGRTYPWGEEPPSNTRCNFGRNMGDTTAVGRYPAGNSPNGLQDMAGNVWEWTSSLYKAYPYNAMDGREDPE
ncbi:MAG: SUMF1/EgtB/PvdO family nonheme iron enzyme, partial [Leptospiraceae bacterium]|nr:SUMF1/EgtB/PvdO family nonheme iron enzyme [Leptospiraceae bacterium]